MSTTGADSRSDSPAQSRGPTRIMNGGGQDNSSLPPWKLCVMNCCSQVPDSSEVVILPCLHVICSPNCLESFQETADQNPSSSILLETRGGAGACLACRLCQAPVPADYDYSRKIIPEREFLKKEDELQLVCEDCIDHPPAVSYCNKCGISLCQDCDKSHSRRINTAAHERQPSPPEEVKQIKLEELHERSKFCNNHDKVAASSVCSTCNHRICGDCLFHHQGQEHNVIVNPEKEGEELVKLFDSVDAARIQWEKESEMKNKLDDDYILAMNKCTEQFSLAAALLEQRKQEAEGKMELAFQRKKTILEDRRRRASIVDASANAALRMRDDLGLLRNLGDVGKANLSRHLRQNLQRISNMSAEINQELDDDAQLRNDDFQEIVVVANQNFLQGLEEVTRPIRRGTESTAPATPTYAAVVASPSSRRSTSVSGYQTATVNHSDIFEEAVGRQNSSNIRIVAVTSLSEVNGARAGLVADQRQQELPASPPPFTHDDEDSDASIELSLDTERAFLAGHYQNEVRRPLSPAHDDEDSDASIELLVSEDSSSEEETEQSANKRQSLPTAEAYGRGKRKSQPKTFPDSIITPNGRKASSPSKRARLLEQSKNKTPSSSRSSNRSPTSQSSRETPRSLPPRAHNRRRSYPEPPAKIQDLIPDMYRDMEYPLQGNAPLRHDPSEEHTEEEANDHCCSFCLNGGPLILLQCDSCPRVFHLGCHIPPLKNLPPEDEQWHCSYDVTKESIEAEIRKKNLPDIPNSQNLALKPGNEREYLIACGFLMECYRIEEIPTMRWRFPEGYKNKFKKRPYHMQYIKERLGAGNPKVFSSVKDMLLAFNQMFDQAYQYYNIIPRDLTTFHHAKNCYQKFLSLLEKYYPNYRHLFDDLKW